LKTAFARCNGSRPQLLRVAASSDRAPHVEVRTPLPLPASRSPLELHEVRDEVSLRLVLRGELDLATAPTVADRLVRLRSRHQSIVLDLDELAFMDASGIRVVMAAAREAARDGWVFGVTRGSPPVRRLFEVTALDQYLPLAR
jgi:anti-anti-sigma factor